MNKKELEEKVFEVLENTEKFCEFVAKNNDTKSHCFQRAKGRLEGMFDLATELGLNTNRINDIEMKLLKFIYSV